jgi:hypothetical protein
LIAKLGILVVPVAEDGKDEKLRKKIYREKLKKIVQETTTFWSLQPTDNVKIVDANRIDTIVERERGS